MVSRIEKVRVSQLNLILKKIKNGRVSRVFEESLGLSMKGGVAE